MKDSKTVPVPNGICDECFKSNTHPTKIVASFESNTHTKELVASFEVVDCYCVHHKTGGIYVNAKGRVPAWTLYTPIERETFFRTIKETLKELSSIVSNKQQQIKKH